MREKSQMAVSRYTPPELSGHKILFKGKRFWIFEISKEYPFEDFEVSCEIVLFDKVAAAPIAFARRALDGFEVALSFTMDHVEVNGATPQELLANAIEMTRRYERHFSGRISASTPRVYRRKKVG